MTTATRPAFVAASESPTTFWALPEADQQNIVDRIPEQDTWVLNVIRNDQGFWYFDLPEYDIYNELLVGGTEKALDWHYLNLCSKQYDQYALEDAEMELVVSSRPLPDCTTQLHLMCLDKEEFNAAYYKDQHNNITCWLCPMLAYLFKDIPATLYLDLYPDTWLCDAD